MIFFLFNIFIFFIDIALFSAITEVKQMVTVKVAPITELTILAGPSLLHINYNQALTGDSIMVSDALSSNIYSYTIVGNIPKKITGRIDTALPAGVTLEATLQAPIGAIALPNVIMNNLHDQDLVKGIRANSKGNNLLITYQLKSAVHVGPIEHTSLQVTLKLVDDIP